jgi:hypothetical protein
VSGPHRTRPFGLSRRTVLRGLGAAVALPFLESLAPKMVRAQSLAAPMPRFFGLYVPCGMYMEQLTPPNAGRDFAMTPILEPLLPVKSSVLVLSGLNNVPAEDEEVGAGDHARGTATFLTATNPEHMRIHVAKSVDQQIADHYGATTRLRSLELGLEAGATAGNCDAGYSCAYSRNIAWASPTTPLAKEVSPRLAFDRLFGTSDARLTAEQIERRRQQNLSILDFVHEDANRVKQGLSLRDRVKLDEYQTGVRELELRIERLEGDDRCERPERPDGTPTDTPGHAKALLDLVVLAFKCDITRVATFMVGNAATGRTFPWLGISDTHHELSHHQGNIEKLNKLQQINRWEVSLLAYLMTELSQIEEQAPDGSVRTILDDTFACLGSELTDGNAHNHDNVPMIVGGHAGGILDSGQHVRFAAGTPVANVFYTLLNGIGVPVARFGDDGSDVLTQIRA